MHLFLDARHAPLRAKKRSYVQKPLTAHLRIFTVFRH